MTVWRSTASCSLRPDSSALRVLIKGDAILATVHFERGVVQHVLVLPNFGVHRVDALAKPVLLGFLLVDRLRVLRFRGR